MSALPLNDVPPIDLAVCSVVAVAALPLMLPIMVLVKVLVPVKVWLPASCAKAEP